MFREFFIGHDSLKDLHGRNTRIIEASLHHSDHANH